MTLLSEGYIATAQIEASAYKLIHNYGRRYGAIVAPPVPVEKIIDFCEDLPIVYERFPDSDGRRVLAKLVVKRPRPEIRINEDHLSFFDEHEGSLEYTFAHELGHWIHHVNKANLQTESLLIGEERPVVLCRTPKAKRDKREWQAEQFAAHLLMPQDLVRRACADRDMLQWSTVYDLRKQFRVTITAFMRRMKELHIVEVLPDKRLVPYQVAQPSSVPSLWE